MVITWGRPRCSTAALAGSCTRAALRKAVPLGPSSTGFSSESGTPRTRAVGGTGAFSMAEMVTSTSPLAIRLPGSICTAAPRIRDSGASTVIEVASGAFGSTAWVRSRRTALTST